MLIDLRDPLPARDYRCSLMSLPLAFKTRVDTIPAQVPYLHADPHAQANWHRTLGHRTRTRIGPTWSGNAQHVNDRNHSLPLHLIAPLLELDQDYLALQTEVRPDDQATPDVFKQIRCLKLQDLADTTALVAELDLVIRVDTTAAHLTGALGKSVWILLPYDPDFRWMLARADSPWYSTARLFRQACLGDWQNVIMSARNAPKTGVFGR